MKAVLFDLDGTLLDTLGDLTDATNYILKKYGYEERSAKEVRSFLGSGAAHLIRSALPCEVEDSVFEKYLKDYVEYYRENSRHKTAPYPGILALLAFLKEQGIKTAIVSNKPDAATRGLCAYYFDMVSLVGIFTNLLTLWMVSFTFYGIMASCILGAIWLPLGKAVAWVISWAIRYVTGVAKLLSRIIVIYDFRSCFFSQKQG